MKLKSDVEAPQSGIRFQEGTIKAYISNENQGIGTLYVTENDIVWINNSSGEGITINYPDISVFAVCTDREKYTESCVYMLVSDENSEEMEDDDSDEDLSSELEIRFAPPGGIDVNDIYQAMQECNKLHPTENGDMSDDSEANSEDDSDSFVPNGSGDSKDNVGQFDDAEMD